MQFTLLHDFDKLKNGEFFLLGTLIAIAIISSCAASRCFMPSVVSRLLSGPNINPTIEDVPDVDIQNSLKELLSANTETDFQTKIQSFPERFSAGVTKFKVNFDDKLEFIENICRRYCLSVCNEEIRELMRGMDLLGLKDILSTHYEQSKIEFIVASKLKVEEFLKIFQNINYTKYSMWLR